MTTTAKTTKTPKPKLLRLTSRAKSPKRPAKEVRAPAPAADRNATLEAAVEHLAAQVRAVPGLDSDAGTPAEQIGEVVKPTRAKAKAPTKAKMPKAAPSSVVLDREPGRGWFHVVIDGARVGAVFRATRKGVAFWAAETPDRALRTEGANRRAAVDQFVAACTRRPS
jgi:hypothetical protein